MKELEKGFAAKPPVERSLQKRETELTRRVWMKIRVRNPLWPFF
jgi:hypothetical protein